MTKTPTDANSGAATDIRLGKLVIKDFYPEHLPIGKGETDAKVVAEGIFEKDSLGKIVPRKNLVFGIIKNDDSMIDEYIYVDDIFTDNYICEKDENNKIYCYINLKITVPVHETIQKGQKRKIVLKKKNEPLEDGECPSGSNSCDVSDCTMVVLD